MKLHAITLADGRILEVTTAGNPAAKAIIFHHGTPGSCTTWDKWLDVVEGQGGFAIAYSRPGYGTSTRRVGRSVIDNASDIAELLAHFAVTSFVSIGWSGGGPHCLADTTLAGSGAAISIAGVAAFDSSDLNFLEGMGEENHIEFGAAMAGPAAIEEWMLENAGPMAQVTGPQVIEALGGLIGQADKNALTPDVAEESAAGFRHALVEGFYGWMDDDLAFVEPWGFDISAIGQPVELWQGDDDFMVPHAHGQWLASKIPTAQLKFVAGEGHISLGENKRSEIVRSALGYLA